MDKTKVIQDLTDFIKIQSVSNDKSRYEQILQAVEFLKNKLQKMGCTVKVLKKENVPPLIIAEYNPTSSMLGARTIGIYAHYDVQPEDPVEEWDSNPFELTSRNGKFYGRGVADDKGHIIQNLTAVSQLINTNKLKNNIVFIFEGEEEVGSENFEDYVNQVKGLLNKVDVFYVVDAGMHSKNVPQIFYGLRGLIYFEINVSTGTHDLHSGVYGNRVLNPIQVLADLFVKIKDVKTNQINIPNFYDSLRKIDQKEMKLLEKTLRTIEEEKENAGVYKIISYNNVHPSLASKIYPSFEIHGIKSGFIGEGSKTIIPYHAMAKFSFRLVEYQDPDEIENLVKKFIKENIEEGVKYELKTYSKGAPCFADINDRYMKKTAEILTKFFGHETLFNRTGGTISAAEILQRLFKKPVIKTGFTLPDDNMHAPNENIDEEMFIKGIEALEKIYSLI